MSRKQKEGREEGKEERKKLKRKVTICDNLILKLIRSI